VHLLILVVVNGLTWFALLMLLARSIWALVWNVTTIEEWEMERHETLLRRSKASGGYLDGPDGVRVQIKRQEFPYDIGIWGNLKQGMGTWNVSVQHFDIDGATSELLGSGLVLPILGNPNFGEWTGLRDEWI
jgi:hypothetical protein